MNLEFGPYFIVVATKMMAKKSCSMTWKNPFLPELSQNKLS